MRQVTQEIVTAFRNGERKSIGNSSTDGQVMLLHGNKIAEKREGQIFITDADWATSTTKERLNGLPNVSIQQKKGVWYLNGKVWNGEWIAV